MMLWQKAGLFLFCRVAGIGCQLLSPEDSMQVLAEMREAPVPDRAVSFPLTLLCWQRWGIAQDGISHAGARLVLKERGSCSSAHSHVLDIAGKECTAVICSAGSFIVRKLMEQQSAWNQ